MTIGLAIDIARAFATTEHAPNDETAIYETKLLFTPITSPAMRLRFSSPSHNILPDLTCDVLICQASNRQQSRADVPLALLLQKAANRKCCSLLW